MTEQATLQLSTVQRKNALVDNMSTIPPFSGESAVSFFDFIEKWEDLSNFFQWDEEEKKFALISRVSGAAARLLKLHKTKASKDLIDILKQRYTQQDTPDVSLSKFLNFKQTATMSVQEFYDRASDLSLRALVIDGMSSEVVQQSRNAMLHSMLLGNLIPEIRKGVIAKDPKTPDEILKFALLEEKACRSVNPSFTSDNINTPNPPLTLACAAAEPQTPCCNDKKEIEELREQLGMLTLKIDKLISTNNDESKQNKQTQPSVYLCYSCGQPNHLARNCPNYYSNFQNPQHHRNFNNTSFPQQNFHNTYRRGNSGPGNPNYRGRANHYNNNRNSRNQSNQNSARHNLNQ